MKKTRVAVALAVAFPFAFPVTAQTVAPAVDAPTKNLGVVTITGGQPTSLPTQIPTTMEGVTREQIEQTVNATDSEDALKYFPSLLVRKRYIGDYNHAILSSRASGTGNSARSAVYADGILLSNYLGNGVGGLSFPPRWGLVTPEEIDRVDVMYGPFSAAYPGNSVGAVVDYVTRMPTRFEAHAKVGFVVQPFELYSTHDTYQAWQTSASVGNKNGDWSWWLNFNHTDSHGQPLTFATSATAPAAPITGAVAGLDNKGAPWFILGTGTEYHTQQDHFKVKLAYDITSTVRAAYTLGVWINDSEGRPATYLRDAAGQPFYTSGSAFALTHESLTHLMHGLSVKSQTKGVFDWEVAASLYDYDKDLNRRNGAANALPAAATGGAGTIADGSGTGWTNLALKGIWRPGRGGHAGVAGIKDEHIVDFGFQRDVYTLSYRTSNIAGNWISDPAGTLASNVGGRTRLQSLYAQDAWAFAPRWKTVLGVRAERWSAYDGITHFSAASSISHPSRKETFISPKGALSYQWSDSTVLKASAGRAVRMPTVGELYGATSTTNSQFINDPNLKPEKSWTTELSAERDFGNGLLRTTLFAEDTRDSLYTQRIVDPALGTSISRVQNVRRIKTTGVEVAWNGSDVFTKGFDLNASVTYAHSRIQENDGFVVTPGDTLGKWQPNIPQWRATALGSYRWNPQWTTSVGVRYSGKQFRTLDNSDVNGFTYQGVSKFLTADLRVRYQISKQWSAAFGIDNLNNDKYWNFHPYPQRSYSAELKVDL